MLSERIFSTLINHLVVHLNKTLLPKSRHDVKHQCVFFLGVPRLTPTTVPLVINHLKSKKLMKCTVHMKKVFALFLFFNLK